MSYDEKNAIVLLLDEESYRLSIGPITTYAATIKVMLVDIHDPTIMNCLLLAIDVL
jgi:hypothetical protein